MVDTKENYKFDVGVKGLNGIFLLQLGVYLSLQTYIVFLSRMPFSSTQPKFYEIVLAQ